MTKNDGGSQGAGKGRPARGERTSAPEKARSFRGTGQKPRSSEHQALSSYIFGVNPVISALANPRRRKNKLMATRNALHKLVMLGVRLPDGLPVEEVERRVIDRLLDVDSVHQGLLLDVDKLDEATLEDACESHLVIVLDQLTDPHNVGAIMRSATAFGAGAMISSWRHSAHETAILAKSAAGALDWLPWVKVGSIVKTLESLKKEGFLTLGLAEEATVDLESLPEGKRYALVLGAEGKGLRAGTRAACDQLVSIRLSGPMTTLNVSNAAAVALYALTRVKEN